MKENDIQTAEYTAFKRTIDPEIIRLARERENRHYCLEKIESTHYMRCWAWK